MEPCPITRYDCLQPSPLKTPMNVSISALSLPSLPSALPLKVNPSIWASNSTFFQASGTRTLFYQWLPWVPEPLFMALALDAPSLISPCSWVYLTPDLLLSLPSLAMHLGLDVNSCSSVASWLSTLATVSSPLALLVDTASRSLIQFSSALIPYRLP